MSDCGEPCTIRGGFCAKAWAVIRPSSCFRDPSSNNVENDLGGASLAGMKSN